MATRIDKAYENLAYYDDGERVWVRSWAVHLLISRYAWMIVPGMLQLWIHDEDPRWASEVFVDAGE